VRLSVEQREDLADELNLANSKLPAFLVEAYEDALHRYVSRRTASDDHASVERMLPLLVTKGREMVNLLDGLRYDGEPLRTTIREELAEWVRRWERLANTRLPRKGRRPDTEIVWSAYLLLAPLERAGVSMELGRNTPIVRGLRLFREWAGNLRGGQAIIGKNGVTTGDYEFAQVLVNTYRSRNTPKEK
jgi:hypothetical protein